MPEPNPERVAPMPAVEDIDRGHFDKSHLERMALAEEMYQATSNIPGVTEHELKPEESLVIDLGSPLPIADRQDRSPIVTMVDAGAKFFRIFGVPGEEVALVADEEYDENFAYREIAKGRPAMVGVALLRPGVPLEIGRESHQGRFNYDRHKGVSRKHCVLELSADGHLLVHNYEPTNYTRVLTYDKPR